MSDRTRRVLVLGLDGGTFDLLDPLMEAGDMPFLRQLARSGSRTTLESVYPAKTIPAWYSFATGRDPGELGIYGFMEPDGGPGKARLVRTFRPFEAFWDRLSRAGHKVGVLNLPLGRGYPVHGFLLPGFFSDASTTYPEGLRREVERALGCPYPGELPVYRIAEREAWLAEATRAIASRARTAAVLTERERPDFLFVLFRETDRVEHQLWDELARPVAEIPADLRRFWSAVDAGCAEVHRAFQEAGGPATTFVVSDHGHGAVRSDFLTNRWLAQEGFLSFVNGDRLDGRRLVSRLLFASQRFAVGRWAGRPIADVLRRPAMAGVQRFVGGSTSFEQAAPRIDWKRTLAYSYPVPEGIYLNRYNPSIDADRGRAIVDDLRGRLASFRDARIEVFEPSRLYRGGTFDRAPALLLRIDGMATESRMDFRYDRPLVKERPRFFYGTGTHRMEGILIAAGDGAPVLRPGVPRQLTDLAPTILQLMGQTPPAELAPRSFAPAAGFAA